VKARKRPEPSLPRRLRVAKKTKFVLHRGEQEGPSFAELVHVGGRARCTAEHARHLVWQETEPEEGLHTPSPNISNFSVKRQFSVLAPIFGASANFRC
jgi:hypothetical protein